MEEKKEETPVQQEEVQLFDFSKKKKRTKKKKKTRTKDSKKAEKTDKTPQDSYKNPFTYEFLLKRINNILEVNNPYAKNKKRILLKPVQLDRISGKKYKWVNFNEFTKILKRSPAHLSQYVSSELGIEVLIADNKLKMEGRRLVKEQLQTILKRYIFEYVKCPLCHGADTTMVKDANIRSLVMKCGSCKSQRVVANIKRIHKK